MKKILVIALSGIGDALMFTPALKLLKKSMSEAEIDVLIMFKGAKTILEENPNVNNIIYFDFLNRSTIASLKFIFSLRRKYDASINVYPANRREYNLINFLIGAPKRGAVKYLRKDFMNLGFLNNARTVENDSIHNVQENINICENLFDKKFSEEPELELFLKESDLAFSQDYLTDNNISEKDLVIGFHPGCATLKNHIKRRWEPEKFAALGKKLIGEYDAKILIFGGPEEETLKENINNQINSESSIAVKTDTLGESAAVMKRCNLFITNDSSLMHVASALKLNIIALLGPTNPNYIHPWKTNYKIVRLDLDCSPCFIYSPRPLICFRNDVKFKCVKEMTVDMVYAAAKEFISR
jgi:lipopolysaccharide heptosyltransferase II